MFRNKFFNEKKIRLVYKLLHDLLLVLFVFFTLTLIAEGLLPGIISARFGLYRVVLLILFVIFSIEMAAKKARATSSLLNGKKTSYALLFVLAALILNGMLGIGLLLSIFILILALAVLYLSYKLLFPPVASS